MTIEYVPVGIACNLKCTYCYQDPMRDAGNIAVPRDWPRARAQLLRENHDFAVFGGEPLLAGKAHLEEVFAFGLERFGRNGIQTNGLLIDHDWVRLFQQYKVSVGVSLDGPPHLNLARSTVPETSRIWSNIGLLTGAGVVPSIICTVHRGNADPAERAALKAWFAALGTLGVRHVNLHMLEVERGKEGLALTEDENTEVFLDLYAFSTTSRVHFEPFGDIRKLLTEAAPNVSCIWNHCDPVTTAAVSGVGPDGTRTNCGRTNKDGVNWVKADEAGFERYLLLYSTPQADGGCRDCRFFAFCKGQCPGTAIDGDWRNRTVHCQTWFRLFERIEQELPHALTHDPGVLRGMEQALLARCGQPRPVSAQHDDWHCDAPSDGPGVPVTWLDA